MNKYISMIVLSVGLAANLYAMDDLVEMAGFIEQPQSNEEIQRRAKAKEKRREQVKQLMEERQAFADTCSYDNYQAVKKYLSSHPNIPVYQYGISLRGCVTTARMAVLLEKKHEIRLGERDKYGSLLHHACCAGNTPMLLKYAIRRYCNELKTVDINARRSTDGKTALYTWAVDAFWGRWKTMFPQAREKLQILLEGGADCTIRDKHGTLPVDYLKHERDAYASMGNKEEEVAGYDILIADLQTAMDARKK